MELKDNNIWAFVFTYDTCECGGSTVSLHFSEEGAQKALEEHKKQKKEEWQKLVDSDPAKGTEDSFEACCPFGEFQEWEVKIFKVLP